MGENKDANELGFNRFPSAGPSPALGPGSQTAEAIPADA